VLQMRPELQKMGGKLYIVRCPFVASAVGGSGRPGCFTAGDQLMVSGKNGNRVMFQRGSEAIDYTCPEEMFRAYTRSGASHSRHP
jgi:hypothetical protein